MKAAPVSAADAPASATQPAAAPAAPAATPAPADTAKPPKAKTKKTKAKKVPASDSAAAKTAAPDTAKAKALADTAKAKAAAVSAPVDTTKKIVADTARKSAAPIDTSKKIAADTAKPASSRAASVDSAKAMSPAPDSAKIAADTTAADSAAAKAKKRKRIVRETTVNSIDELKGRYRSPKKALFMSLIVPGLGQAYVGQHWSNYARGAAYFLIDVALISGWHYYVVEKQDDEIAKYKRFADTHWSQGAYEDSIHNQSVTGFDKGRFDKRNPHRVSYCDYVQEVHTNSGLQLNKGCKDPGDPNFSAFQANQDDAGWSVDSVSAHRAQFDNVQGFYEIIGKEEEFITGWDDANDNPIVMGDTTYNQLVDGKLVSPTTDHQQQYVSMRDQANEYARMQAYFLGGIVLNHIVSALDAALAAHFHNLSLYQTEVRWYDRVRLESRFAWQGGLPTPAVAAVMTF